MSDSQAITSRPWGNLASYTDAEWWEVWQSLFDGSEDRGPLLKYLNGLEVSASSPAAMTIGIATGAGFVAGLWFKNDTARTLSVAANGGGAARYDLVFAHYTRATQQVRLRIVDGTAATCATAVAPAANAVATYQVGVDEWAVPLACVTVAPGATSIGSGNITDLREFSRFRTDPGSLPDGSTIGVDGNRQMYVLDGGVGVDQISTAIAGAGLVGGGGAALDVNPDGVTLEVNADQLRIMGGEVTAGIREDRTRTFYVGANKMRATGAGNVYWGSPAGLPDTAEGWMFEATSKAVLAHVQIPADFASDLLCYAVWAHTYSGGGSQDINWGVDAAAESGSGDLSLDCDQDITDFSLECGTSGCQAVTGEENTRKCSLMTVDDCFDLVTTGGQMMDLGVGVTGKGGGLDWDQFVLLGLLFEYTADM
jgi:hypothetical protein